MTRRLLVTTQKELLKLLMDGFVIHWGFRGKEKPYLYRRDFDAGSFPRVAEKLVEKLLKQKKLRYSGIVNTTEKAYYRFVWNVDRQNKSKRGNGQ